MAAKGYHHFESNEADPGDLSYFALCILQVQLEESLYNVESHWLGFVGHKDHEEIKAKLVSELPVFTFQLTH